jgi:cobalt-zinc-cadmium efflux system outer membrane protein
MTRIHFLAAILLHCSTYATEPAPKKLLEFNAAYRDILDQANEYKAAEEGVLAKRGEKVQARAYINPELTVTLENLGRRYRHEDDVNEVFVGVTQVLELGGKRCARIRVAEADEIFTKWDLEIMRSEIFGDLLKAFIGMAVAQERLSLAREQHKLLDQTLGCMQTNSENGKTSHIQTKRADVACKAGKLQFYKRQTELSQAKKTLIGLWDCHPPVFDEVCYTLYEITAPPPYETLVSALANHPAAAQAQANTFRACELVALEKTQRVPDLAVMVGVSTQRFYQEPAFNVGIDIPLPIFNQNQGNISRAFHKYSQAVYNQMDVSVGLEASLSLLYDAWVSAYEQALALKDAIIPAAHESYHLAQASYEEGKFNYLELLDARSTLFSIQQQYLDALEEYHQKRAEILTLTGKRG